MRVATIKFVSNKAEVMPENSFILLSVPTLTSNQKSDNASESSSALK